MSVDQKIRLGMLALVVTTSLVAHALNLPVQPLGDEIGGGVSL